MELNQTRELIQSLGTLAWLSRRPRDAVKIYSRSYDA